MKLKLGCRVHQTDMVAVQNEVNEKPVRNCTNSDAGSHSIVIDLSYPDQPHSPLFCVVTEFRHLHSRTSPNGQVVASLRRTRLNTRTRRLVGRASQCSPDLMHSLSHIIT